MKIFTISFGSFLMKKSDLTQEVKIGFNVLVHGKYQQDMLPVRL